MPGLRGYDYDDGAEPDVDSSCCARTAVRTSRRRYPPRELNTANWCWKFIVAY
jgi:hypothetical protein